MNILLLGTVVRLKKGKGKMMITSCLPLCNHNCGIGYLDYRVCLYLHGQTSQQSYFLN
ncbi:MAG: DUF4176 domain-containing protein [Dorea sp.]|nr:DUF4176 domain-containing protein [Dorea sp.]